MILLELFELKQQRPSLFKRAPYVIKERAANDKARFQRLLDFQGPDKDTLKLLQANGDKWIANPSKLLDSPAALGSAGLQPQARIVMCYQSTVRSDA